MTITKNAEATKLTLAIVGRIDTSTAPEFEAHIDEIADVTELVLDFAGVEYISSAGLRVVLKAQKLMNKNDCLKQAREELAYLSGDEGFQDMIERRADYIFYEELEKNARYKKGKEEGIKEGIEKGKEEGRKNEKIETAKKLLKLKLSIKEIMEVTGLTEEEILNLNK